MTSKLNLLISSLALVLGGAEDPPAPETEPAPAEKAAGELPRVRLPRSTIVDGEAQAGGAVLTLHADGRIVAGTDEEVYDPDAPADSRLRDWLIAAATEMRKTGADLTLPDDPLLLRVDPLLPFAFTAAVMMHCGHKDVRIWRIEFAVLAPDPEDDAAPAVATTARGAIVRAHLPWMLDGEPDPEDAPRVIIRVRAPGKQVPGADPDSPFEYDRTRRIEYRLGTSTAPRPDRLAAALEELRASGSAYLRIQVSADVTHGEVVDLMSTARQAGFRSFSFQSP